MTIMNELDGFVIRFDSPEKPSGNCFYFNNRLMIALQKEDGAEPLWRTLSSEPAWEYALFGGLCVDRCIEAEHGRLLVDGKKISPENYLRLWAKRAQACITVAQAAERGFALTEVICRSQAKIKNAEHEAALRSFLVGQQGLITTWRIPLSNAQNMALMDIVHHGIDYDYGAGETANTRLIELSVAPSVTTGSSSAVKAAQSGLFDLEVAA